MPTDTPISGTQTIHPNNEKNTLPVLGLTPGQQKYVDFRRMRIWSAQQSRDGARTEYDDMPFLVYMDILKKADDQYVPPRKNAQDTSINLGTIRDKDTSLLEYAMSHDWEPIAQVFDEDDDSMEELAETGEDLVRKSLLMEEWKEKSKLIYRSMIAFGTAFVEDAWVERWIMQKTLSQGFKPGMGSDKAQWTEKLVKQMEGAQARLWDVRKCYPGDVRKFFMRGPQGQPFFFTVEYESYDVVKTVYGNWDRWKYVPTYTKTNGDITLSTSFSSSWTLRPITPNSVEIIKYYDPIANEFAITLNGIDMLPIMVSNTTIDGIQKELISGYPLSEISPSGEIPFAKYDLEPMHEFYLSKSQPAKMRVSADVENMMVKAFIGMFKQKWKPTLGNKSGRQFGPEVTDPATVINDIRDGDLFPVLPNYQGAMPADFSFFEIMKKELDKNSIDRSWQGSGESPQDETATKDMNDRKAQSLKVAALFDGIRAGNNQLYWLRQFNIQKNWTKAIDSSVDEFNKTIVQKYRTVTISTEVDGGQKATKKIVFTKNTPKLADGEKKASLKDSMDVHQEEIDHAKKNGGQEPRITKIHPELYASLKSNWYWDSVAVPNDSDPLSYMMFAKQIVDAQNFFGADSLNVKKLKHRFSKLTGNDFDTWFVNEQELQQKQAAAQASVTPATLGTPQPAQAPGQPSIAGAAKGMAPAQALGAVMQ